MQISNNFTTKNNINFRAKFLNNESLKQLAQYSVEHGKFEKLNTARKNIDSSCLQTRLSLNIKENKKGIPVVSFTKYSPKKNVIVPQSLNDYEIIKITEYTAPKKMNPLKFAFEKFIKLSNNAPHNNMYKDVVISNK